MQHSNSQKVITGKGYSFLSSHVRGQGSWAVNLKQAKIFGPSPLKLHRPYPTIVNDCSLSNIYTDIGLQTLQNEAKALINHISISVFPTGHVTTPKVTQSHVTIIGLGSRDTLCRAS